MDSIGPILTVIGSIILVLLKAWQDGKPGRDKENRNEEIQRGRQAITGGDVAAVEQRIDRVPARASGTAARLGSDEDTQRRLAALTGGGGVADLRQRPGEDPGGGGGIPIKIANATFIEGQGHLVI